MTAHPNAYVSELKNKLIEMLEGVVFPEMSRTREQCIYKVPQIIRQANPQAYTPNVISVGPFHSPLGTISNNTNLHEMEELKLKYLKGFLNRTELCMDDLVFKVQEWENTIRNCYAGPISFDSNDFLQIIIVDACFIIEHFHRCFSYKDWMENDPILLKPWLLNAIGRDLILIENQLPFFVLQKLYNLANINFPSFNKLTIKYFGLLAFEECHISDKRLAYISQYFTLLDILINTEKDVSILVDKKIIVNWMSDANEVATMVNNLCKNSLVPPLNSDYLSLCRRLNGFYENPRNKYKAIFVHEYFNTPWKIASNITAILLVLFTLIQAVCSIWSVVKS